MKTNIMTLKRIGMALMSGMMLCTATLLSGCSNEEDLASGIPDATRKAGTFTFNLGGAAAGTTTTRATSEAKDKEKNVESLYIALFTEDGSLYKLFSTESETTDQPGTVDYDKITKGDDGNYTFQPYYAGDYTAYFIANPDADLVTAMKALTPVTSTLTDFEALETQAAADQSKGGTGEAGSFLMSSGRKNITIASDTQTSSGTILLTRLAVRFDIVNSQPGDGTSAEGQGAKINSVQLLKAPAKSGIVTPTTMDKDDINNSEAVAWNTESGGNVVTDPTTQAETLTLYSYENINTGTENDGATAVKVSYKLGGTDNKEMIIYLKAEDVNLAAKRNTLFRINLNCTYGTYTLEVIDWTTGERVNIHNNELDIVYEEGNANFLGKIGDYVYYTEGDEDVTFSDGGLRKMKFNGRLEWADAKPGPDLTRNCIGIIFSNMPSQKDKDAGFKRGYIVALKNITIATNTQWKSTTGLSTYVPTYTTMQDAINDLDGYTNCKNIKDNNKLNEYPVFEYAMNYSVKVPTSKTSGWYLPALGQIVAIARNFTYANVSSTTTLNTGQATNEYYGAENVSQNIKRLFGGLQDSQYDVMPLSGTDWLYTTTQGPIYAARGFWNGNKNQFAAHFNVGLNEKYTVGFIRPVLAF